MGIFMKKIILKGTSLIMTAALLTSLCACSAKKGSTQQNNTVYESTSAQTNDITFESRQIPLASVTNARQLGGYIGADGRRVKNNVLIRTGKLDNLSDSDAEKLSKEYSVKHIIDFRMERERTSGPDKPVSGADNIWISVMEFDMSHPEIKETMKKMSEVKDDKIQVLIEYAKIGSLENLYKSILTSKSGQEGFARFFDILLDSQNGAVLWHCTHGKDRTGLAAALLLYALGVDEETIIKDFELSNVPYTKEREYIYQEAVKRGCDNDYAKTVSLLTAGVDKTDLIAALDTVKEQYGSIHDYLNNQLGVSDDDIKALRDKYLE